MTSPARLLALALALGSMSAVIGCGARGPTTVDAGGGVDAARADADGGDDVDAGATVDSGTAPDAGGGDAGGPCAYLDSLNPFCETDADCDIGLHQTDCCGNARMIGFANGQERAYMNGEALCMASYPDCECPAGLPITDSGETVTDTDSVRAACVTRGPGILVCITYVTERPTDS